MDAQAKTTTFTFDELRPIKSRQKATSVLCNTGKQLANAYIRFYALVRTPKFLHMLQIGDADSRSFVGEIDQIFSLEGEQQRRYIVHRRRESRARSAKLAQAIEVNGRLICEVPGCGFDFQEVYGEMGVAYAHVHHRVPLKAYHVVIRSFL